jgi:hypothetical protein
MASRTNGLITVFASRQRLNAAQTLFPPSRFTRRMMARE